MTSLPVQTGELFDRFLLLLSLSLLSIALTIALCSPLYVLLIGLAITGAFLLNPLTAIALSSILNTAYAQNALAHYQAIHTLWEPHLRHAALRHYPEITQRSLKVHVDLHRYAYFGPIKSVTVHAKIKDGGRYRLVLEKDTLLARQLVKAKQTLAKPIGYPFYTAVLTPSQTSFFINSPTAHEILAAKA